MYKLLFIGIIFFSSNVHSQPVSGPIQFVLTGFENNRGGVQCNLYASKRTWFKQPKKIVKTKIKAGTARCVFQNVVSGQYSLFAFHDENDNGKVDHAFILSYPLEGVCISNNPSSTFGPPNFKSAAFVHAGIKTNIFCKFKYW